jgi:hypothetical protein
LISIAKNLRGFDVKENRLHLFAIPLPLSLSQGKWEGIPDNYREPNAE